VRRSLEDLRHAAPTARSLFAFLVQQRDKAVGFASEAYTLRQHIDFVRHAVMERINLPLVA
jgi:hypothetical protein